jgi:Uma2 family endonuclease
MLQKQPKYYTPAEYLELEEKANYKSEYFEGEIFAMSGGSTNHNRIAVSICTLLDVAFEGKPCEVFSSDVRLLVQANGLYTYPDVMVVCGSVDYAEDRNDTITNPIVIFEVLSKSTRDYDRGKKFERYRELASLQDYLLIDQARVYIEHYHKVENGRWVLTLFNNPDTLLTLSSIGVNLAVSRIYHKVVWPPTKPGLKEAPVPYTILGDDSLLTGQVVILEKEGRPIAALVPITEYRAFQSWCEAEADREEEVPLSRG